MVKKTSFDSYCLGNCNNVTEGCKHCVLGKKLVLFISGKCSRNCWYCSLSNKRKNKDIMWANERECKIGDVNAVIEEVRASNADSAGITGGDPLLFLDRTIKYATALKKEFGKKFHIHVYLPLTLVTPEKLEKLSKCIDEVRFHPNFLAQGKEEMQNDMEKIKIACSFWKRENMGIEMPCFPEKKKEILEFIRSIDPYIGFANLNELEISETNDALINKHYNLNDDSYTIRGSKPAGIWILGQCEKLKVKAKVHFCSANTKNSYQYQNRLKLHNILPFGHKTNEGTVIYLVTKKLPLGIKTGYFIDKQKNQVILSEKLASILLKKGVKIRRIEEHPTSDRESVEEEDIN